MFRIVWENNKVTVYFGEEIISETNNFFQMIRDIKNYSDQTFGGNRELKDFVSELIK